MLDAIARALIDCCAIGQIAIRKIDGGFAMFHRDDDKSENLETFRDPEAALSLSKFDDAGNYRPLKTAPNLRRGWRIEVEDLAKLTRALDYFYPGRLSIFAACKQNRLGTTSLRETLNRQSGMYRIAAKISDEQLNDVVGSLCRSDSGCLRTILWKRDSNGTTPSKKLPPEKFDQAHDQTGKGERTVPLLCQEACNLLVNECRKAVKAE